MEIKKNDKFTVTIEDMGDVWMRSAYLYAGSVTSGWITAKPAVC